MRKSVTLKLNDEEALTMSSFIALLMKRKQLIKLVWKANGQAILKFFRFD